MDTSNYSVAGWYADPLQKEQYRWWNGARWTNAIAWIVVNPRSGKRTVAFELDYKAQAYLSAAEKKFDDKQSWDPPKSTSPSYSYTKPEEPGSIGWGLLGFFFPIVGVILFIVWPRHIKLTQSML